ncbi:MAG: DUF4229 domain-containing protein [Actinomycetes bacterium]
MTADRSDEPAAPQPAAEPATGLGRAVVVYTALRLLLFLAAFLVLRLVVDEVLLALGGAVLASALLSIPLLAPYRQRLNAAAADRAERREAERQRRRERLGEDPSAGR